MKTIENIKELIKGLGPDRVVEVAVRKLQDLLYEIENAEFKYSLLKSDNDILRQAQRNQAMGSAEMQRENQDLREIAVNLGEFWAKKYDAKLNEVIALQSKLDEAEKQEPLGYAYDDSLEDLKTVGMCRIYECKQKFILSAPKSEFPVYAKPIPAQQEELLTLKEENKELTERLRCACDTIESLRSNLDELRMQYISDVGQEQSNYSVLETLERLREHSDPGARDPLDILSELRHDDHVAIRKQSFHRFNNSGIGDVDAN